MSATPLFAARATRETRYDVVGLGECSLDVVARVSRWPGVGEKGTVETQERRAGGQIATSLLGCARLGLRTAYLGAVGRDRAGKRALAPLDAAGVDLSAVRRSKGARTRMAYVFVRSSDGERSVLEHRDSNLRIKPRKRAAAIFDEARMLMADTTDLDATRWAIERAGPLGIATMLDADALFPGWERALALVDFPVVSRQFADECGQSRDPRACLRRLTDLGARGAVVTLGEAGAIGLFGDREVSVPAYRVAALDTTGAGDAFHAGFAYGLLAGFEARTCMSWGCAVAALNCTGEGAQGDLANVERVSAFMETTGPRSA